MLGCIRCGPIGHFSGPYWDTAGSFSNMQGSHALNYVCKISRTWKVLENEFGPGNLMHGPGTCWAMTRTADADAKICVFAHFWSVFEQFLWHLFATCDSDEHILQYGWCYHAVYIWLVTAVCLYTIALEPSLYIHDAVNGSQLALCDVVSARWLASKQLDLSHRRTLGMANGQLVSRGPIYKISYDNLVIILRWWQSYDRLTTDV